jgi:hypothetical protein
MFILVRNSWRICNASRLFRVPKYVQTFTDGIAIAQYAERRSFFMPEKQTMKRARRAKREGKAPSTQAGQFVREEIHHIREGKHGARSTKQAIAIGLSKARRAGGHACSAEEGQSFRVNAAQRRTGLPGESQKEVTVIWPPLQSPSTGAQTRGS